MAQPMPAVAYFRFRHNDQAPLFVAHYEHDAAQMRKHIEFFECDADGKALDGVSVSEPKMVRGAPEPELEAVVVPAGTDAAKAAAFTPKVRVNGKVGAKATVRKGRA